MRDHLCKARNRELPPVHLYKGFQLYCVIIAEYSIAGSKACSVQIREICNVDRMFYLFKQFSIKKLHTWTFMYFRQD